MPSAQLLSPRQSWRALPDRAGSIGALIIGLTLVHLLLAGSLPLLPQEAYYWSWSQQLDWSYFDHPPLAAYAIALTTALVGQTIFGIKLAAVAWSVGWNLLWARLVIDMFGSRRLAFCSVAVLNLCLVYLALGVGPTPDGPLLFGWIGTVWAVWRISAGASPRWWFVAGAFAGLALLGKYSAVLLLPVVLLYLVVSPQQRHWLRRPQPYLAIVLAVAMFSPVIFWNAEREWASFAFQSSQRVDGMTAFKPHHFLALVGTQLLVVTPYLFVLCMAALVRGARGWSAAVTDDRSRLLWLSAAVPLLLFSVVSFRSQAKINWLAPAYWSLIILAVRHLLAHPTARWRAGLWSSAAFCVIGMVIALAPAVPAFRGLYSWTGWQAAAQRVALEQSALHAAGQRSFVFSPNYKSSSLLRFYLPDQPRTYAQDIYGASALQFDYWPLPDDLRGATGLLVLSDQSQSELDLKRLQPYFDSVVLADVVETRSFGRLIRRIEIYRCTGYKGHPRLTGQRSDGPQANQEAAE